MSILSTLSLGDMPRPFNWYYANSTDRAAALSSGTFVATDEGKFARQLNDDSIWMLKFDSSYSWVFIGGGGELNSPQSGSGSLNGSGVLSISISSSITAVVAIAGSSAITGLLYVTNGGGGSWSITSKAGVVDSGAAIFWIAY